MQRKRCSKEQRRRDYKSCSHDHENLQFSESYHFHPELLLSRASRIISDRCPWTPTRERPPPDTRRPFGKERESCQSENVEDDLPNYVDSGPTGHGQIWHRHAGERRAKRGPKVVPLAPGRAG